MEININGKTADITLESEKTLGEVLTGIHQWIEGSGLFLSGLEVDGKIYGSLSMDKAFDLSLDGIGAVNIKTSGWAELMLEALVGLKCNLTDYETLDPVGRQEYCLSLDTDPTVVFLKKNAPELYSLIQPTLEGSFSGASFTALINERIREIENPREEMAASKALIDDIAQRLEDLPLDIQTGKDHRAAETITLFSTLTEKIYRLVFLFRYFGTGIDGWELSTMDGSGIIKVKDYIEEFNTALKELISAYENKDIVLVGDLAEYELSPRLRCLCSVLCNKNSGEENQE
jgi:hypothetical protein